MKLTDLALVFVVILLPIVIVVYVNTSFVIRAEREELYYKNMITSAVSDATNAMKNVENEDNKIDYGYSGIIEKKVSVNAQVAVDTFFTSLYNNLGIRGNEGTEKSIKSYIPVVSVIDYDGIYIYSAEETATGIDYTLKPKKYFTYTYYIDKVSKDVVTYTPGASIDNANANLLYQVTFTQDDYIYLKIFKIEYSEVKELAVDYNKNFYLTDEINNKWLVGDVIELYSMGSELTSTEIDEVREKVINVLKNKREEIIAQVCMKEIAYAINAHNYYAKKAGIGYDFRFNIDSDSDWYETVNGIGVLAVVQGISLGNRYLNYSAYSISDLTSAKKYYLSDELHDLKSSAEMYEQLKNYKYYHVSDTCPIYQAYLKYIGILGLEKIVPHFMYNKEEAASNGFRACFICKP